VKKKPPKRRTDEARALRSRQYHQRVVPKKRKDATKDAKRNLEGELN
jgi:hypothetical protein